MRIAIDEAAPKLEELLETVVANGETIDLEKNDRVVGTIVPPKKAMTGDRLLEFMNSLPKLGDDAESFEKDVLRARTSFPPDPDPWA